MISKALCNDYLAYMHVQYSALFLLEHLLVINKKDCLNCRLTFRGLLYLKRNMTHLIEHCQIPKVCKVLLFSY